MRLPRPEPADLFWASVIFCALGLTIFALTGCATFGSSITPRVGQEQAAWIIWHDCLGRNDTPPLIRWVTGKDLDCDDQRAGRRGFQVLEVDPSDPDAKVRVRCDQGETWSPLEVRAALHPEDISFAQSVVPHEYEHAELLRRGIFFGHHERPDFFTRIDRCDELLIKAGR